MSNAINFMKNCSDAFPKNKSFLLRCTEIPNQNPNQISNWRFSLQDSETGEQHGFADAESLLIFLLDVMPHLDQSVPKDREAKA